MTTNSPLQAVPVPELSDLAGDGPASFLAMATALEKLGVMRFTNAAARDAAITSPTLGDHAFLTASKVLTYYDGSRWIPISGSYSAIGTGWTRSTSFSDITGASLTLPAGNWLIEGKFYASTSTAAVRATFLELWNSTDGAQLDGSGTSTPATSGDLTLMVIGQLAVTTTPKTVKLRASVSAVDGTQVLANARIRAWPQAVFL